MTSQFKSKKEVVYDQIRQEILEGVHQPGTRLIIDELAHRIGVSQIPIREAMRQLEADGFITIAPHIGATVTHLDANFIYEVFALLESMEVICSKAACPVITDAEISALESMIDEMESNLDAPHIWSHQNKEMHLFICNIAKTELVYKMMLRVFDHWDRLRFHYLKNVFGLRIPEAQSEHRQILDALRNRDSEKVEQIVRLHNQRALQSYIQYLQSAGHLELS